MDSYEEKELKKFFWKYEQALKYLDLVMESYVSSLEISDEHNPVEHYKGRIKNIDSIRKKLAKKGFEFTIKNMEEQLHDIAGIRIVCHFRNDLNELIEIFKNNPNISVIFLSISLGKDHSFLYLVLCSKLAGKSIRRVLI